MRRNPSSSSMRFSSLNEWLAWQETLHPDKIDLGLERVRQALHAMGLSQPSHAVITVGGTNGKGSTVAMLESILGAAGYRVGVYTSPHLLRYNERVRVCGVEATDKELCTAFERVDQARGSATLTYFEFGTLAALDIFSRSALDAAVLEVGMGGRLDAVNVLDADVAVVTSIGIDHVQWLGDSREKIGREKAGIFRAGRPAVCGDMAPPQSLLDHAGFLDAPLHVLNRDFGYDTEATGGWSWWSRRCERHALPVPALRGIYQYRNAATALMALDALSGRLPVNQNEIRTGLSTVQLPGRFQVIDGAGRVIVDVAHNPHGAQALAETLMKYPVQGQTHAVFAMLADKDIQGVVREMRGCIDAWHVAGLSVERGASAGRMMQELRIVAPEATVYGYESIAAAFDQAQAADRVVVFGSFYTVAEILNLRGG